MYVCQNMEADKGMLDNMSVTESFHEKPRFRKDEDKKERKEKGDVLEYPMHAYVHTHIQRKRKRDRERDYIIDMISVQRKNG